MSRASDIYGPDYTMEQVCKGCQQRHRCASCLDGSSDEYLPPSALHKLTANSVTMARGVGCTPLLASDGRVIGFVCRRGR